MSSAIVAKSNQKYSEEEDISPILRTADFWLDMSDTTRFTLLSTTRINTLTDKLNKKTITRSGNISYDTLRKGIKPSGLAGTDFLTIGLASPSTATTANETVFVVSYIFRAGTSAFLGGTATGTRSFYASANGILYGRYGATNVTGPATIPNERLFVACAQLTSSTNVNLYYNGRYLISGSPGGFTASTTTQNIFRAGGVTTQWFRGAIYEMLIFPSALTNTQVDAINYYLMRKWKVVTSTTSVIPSPLSITSSPCTLWLDGNDASTITYGSGTQVSQWSDKSGNGYHATQPTAGNRPSYDSTLKGVLFTAANFTAFNTTCPFSPTETVFIVANIAVSSSVDCILGSSNTSNGRYFRIHSTGGIFVSNTTTLYTVNYDVISTTDKHLITWTNNGTSGFFEAGYNTSQDFDSTTAFTYAAGSFTNVIGATRPTYAAPYNTYIYEVIIFNSGLSASDRLAICQYLTNKWNIGNNAPVTDTIYYPLYNSRPFTRPFNPLDVGGCVLWLDAADAASVTFASGSTTDVQTWADKSGNGYNASGGVSNYPQYTLNGLNKLPIIQLRNALDRFVVSGYNYTDGSLSIFVVVRMASSQPASNNLIGIVSAENGAGSQTGRSIYADKSVSQYGIGFVSGGTQSRGLLTGYTYTAESWDILSATFYSTTSVLFTIDGTIQSTGITSSNNGNNTSGLKIGARDSTGSFATNNAQCDIAEVIIYNIAPNIQQIRAVESYLAQKWGLVNTMAGTTISTTFTPTSVLNCSMWIDASDSSTVTQTSGTVSSVTDKSGSGNSLTSGTGFTYNQVKFNATYPSFYNLAGTTGFNIGRNSLVLSAPITYFIVAQKIPGLSDFPYIFDGVNSRNWCYFGNAVQLAFGAGTSLVYNFDASTPFILCLVNNGASSQIYHNGVLVSSGNVGANTLNAFILGCALNTTNPFNGHICESIIYSRVLTNTERSSIENYLARKWGIEYVLPIHPARLYKALSSPFDPRQIGALALWLDASDITTITPGTIGASVTQWNDKSGNNLSALIGNYTLPTYDVSSDRKPYVNFGVNQSMFVANFPYNVTWNVFIAMNTTSLGARWFISPYDTRLMVMMGFNPNNKILDMLPAQTDLSGEHIENTSAVNTNGTAGYFWFRDGTQGATASLARTFTATTLTLGIGANGSGSDPSVASGSVIRVYEIIIYCGGTNTLLTAAQRQRVEGYLAHKWGLQETLPSTHPFKKVRP